MKSQIIVFGKRAVGWVLINISPPNILGLILWPKRYHHKSQDVLGSIGMNGLNTNGLKVLTLYYLAMSRDGYL